MLVVFQPGQLAKALVGSRAWRRAPPLAPGERVDPEPGRVDEPDPEPNPAAVSPSN